MTDPGRSLAATVSLVAVIAALFAEPLRSDGREGKAVFHWRDAQGEAHFSDTPPPVGTAGVNTEIFLTPEPRSPSDDYFSVINQSRRMQERRLAVERERREARIEAREFDYQLLYGWRSWYYAPYLGYPYYTYSGIGHHYPRRHRHSVWPGHGPLPPHRRSEPSRPRHSVGQAPLRPAPLQRLR